MHEKEEKEILTEGMIIDADKDSVCLLLIFSKTIINLFLFLYLFISN